MSHTITRGTKADTRIRHEARFCPYDRDVQEQIRAFVEPLMVNDWKIVETTDLATMEIVVIVYEGTVETVEGEVVDES